MFINSLCKGLIPDGNTTVLSPPIGKSFDWNVNVASATNLMFVMIDSQGRQGGASDLLTVGASDDSSCLNNLSPSSTATPTPTATSTNTPANTSTPTNSSTPTNLSTGSKTSIGAIAGTAAGGLIALVGDLSSPNVYIFSF